MGYKEYEPILNMRLANLLKEKHGLDAKVEKTGNGRNRIDIEVEIKDIKIAIEAEHGQSKQKKKEAIKDANKRLDQNYLCAIAVCYPDNSVAEQIQADTEFLWQVREKKGEEGEWRKGNLAELNSTIRGVLNRLGEPDLFARNLSYSLDEAVKQLTKEQKELLAEVLDPHIVKKSGNQAAKRSMLIIATATMFHSRLDDHLKSMKPEKDNRNSPPTDFNDNWPPQTARNCADSDDPVGELLRAWDLILALDYKPIFQTGRTILNSCAANPSFTKAIEITAKASLKISGNIVSFRHDLLGRIFHVVLPSAKNDGSFYTSTAAATLLTSLTMKNGICNRNDSESVAGFKVVDPACGTGTLLMSVADYIIQNIKKENIDKLSRNLIEQTLFGYDVNLTATHLAATTLGLLSPQTQFRNMRIARTLLGVSGDKAHLGSLSFLTGDQLVMGWPRLTGSAEQVESGEDLIPKKNSFDLVIMNPPYTRGDLRYNQFDKATGNKLTIAEKEIFSKYPPHLSSNGNQFLILAEHLNKLEDGATLASVLPLATATNPSALATRKFLAKKYHIETIIISYDPKKFIFSENTTIGEMLLICRRKKEKKQPTNIVKLSKNPDSPDEAFSIGSEIKKGETKNGIIQQFPREKIEKGDWSGVQFLSPYLCEKFTELKENRFTPPHL